MNKIEDIEKRLFELEKNIEKLIIITDNIQSNYLDIYTEIKEIRKEIKNLYIKEEQLDTNLRWLIKLKDYSIYIGAGGVVILAFKYWNIFVNLFK